MALLANVCASSPLSFFDRLAAGGHGTIVTYGTSLTEKGRWVDQLRNKTAELYPGRVTVINSGGSGQYSQWGLANLDKKVIAHEPDLVLIEFSVNDSVARFGCSVEQARLNLESMVDRILAARPGCEIVLMTTSIADKHPEGHESHRVDIEAYHQNYRDVAAERGLLLIDFFPVWLELKNSNPARYDILIPDSIHPGTKGEMEIVVPEIFSALGISCSRSR